MNEQEKIISEAAAWVIRVEAGLDGAGQDAFVDWLAADRRHGAEYEWQRAHWARLDILADWRPEHAARPNRDLLAPFASARPPVFAWARAHWRAFAGVALGVTAAAAACAALLVALNPGAATVSAAGANDAISTIEQSKLDDGTVVELNRGASITVNFTPTERCVKINRGEVNFQVTKDSTRPFIVDTGSVTVRALGTNFNVRRDSDAVEVLVTSGVVQVHAAPEEQAGVEGADSGPARENTFVKAGQMAIVSRDAQVLSLRVQTLGPNKIKNMTAWHPRLLDIESQPLSSVVEEFNKCNAPIRLVIADPELEKTEVSATLRSDQVENLVRMLEGALRVKAERTGDVVTLRRILGI